jgi:hypothetical protein
MLCILQLKLLCTYISGERARERVRASTQNMFIYKFIINNIKHALRHRLSSMAITFRAALKAQAYRFFRGSQNLSKSYVLIV